MTPRDLAADLEDLDARLALTAALYARAAAGERPTFDELDAHTLASIAIRERMIARREREGRGADSLRRSVERDRRQMALLAGIVRRARSRTAG